MRGRIVGRVHLHAAKFVKVKKFLMKPNALLHEDHRAWIFAPNDNCDNSHRNSEQDQPNSRKDNIDQTFKKFRVHTLIPHVIYVFKNPIQHRAGIQR